MTLHGTQPLIDAVSTHSRPKAAGRIRFLILYTYRLFQHTAARRRLVIQSLQDNILEPVSTHSRPKAAGAFTQRAVPAAAVSTHSRPKAAGPEKRSADWLEICFNTQPPEGGWRLIRGCFARSVRFQHTAARRRLEPLLKALLRQVSQPRFR